VPLTEYRNEFTLKGTAIDSLLSAILRGEPVDWPESYGREGIDELLDRAAHHGVQALVFEAIERENRWEFWPSEIRAGLLDACRAEAARDLLRSHVLGELLSALSKAGIPVLVIKGAAIAGMLYEHSRLRKRLDSDLFIHFKDIAAVRQVLASLDFSVYPPFFKSHQFVCGMEKGGTWVEIDIHWRILNAARFARLLSFDEATKRSVPIPGLPGSRTLEATDALLLACAHRRGRESHDPDRLIWLYDIHLLAGTFSADSWQIFAQRAVAKGAQRACLDGLLTAKECFRTFVPDEVIQTLKKPELSGGFASSNLALLIDDFRVLRDWPARSGLLRELFFPSPDALLERYEKRSRAWIPILYARQVFGGLARRLSLQ